MNKNLMPDRETFLYSTVAFLQFFVSFFQIDLVVVIADASTAFPFRTLETVLFRIAASHCNCHQLPA